MTTADESEKYDGCSSNLAIMVLILIQISLLFGSDSRAVCSCLLWSILSLLHASLLAQFWNYVRTHHFAFGLALMVGFAVSWVGWCGFLVLQVTIAWNLPLLVVWTVWGLQHILWVEWKEDSEVDKDNEIIDGDHVPLIV